MEAMQFAGFTWPKREWALPKGKPAARVGKKRYTSGYYQDAPCMAGKGEISFYWGEGGEESGRLWTLRAKLDTKHAWYCDSFQDGTVTPFVFALPHGRGWLSGWTMGDGMISSVDRYICMDEADAMNDARGMARIAAEKMREDDQQDQADQQINQAEHDIGEACEVIKMCEKELVDMESCNHLVARGVLVERIQQEQATIRKLREKIALLEREPWQAVA